MGSSERRAKVLEAIVRDYVSTREPVGSRSIVERYDLGVSPATIRNDMAALEEAGLIHRPHTSAGRVPTDQGYRQFVDSLESIKPLSPSERRAMRKLLDGAVDLDDVVERAVRALAQVTRQVAVVQYPSLQRVSLRHVEVVAVGVRYVILLIVTDAGRVEQRSLRMEAEVDADDLADLGRRFNAQLAGLRLADIAPSLEALLADSPERLRPVAEAVGRAILDALRADGEERIVMAGAPPTSRGIPSTSPIRSRRFWICLKSRSSFCASSPPCKTASRCRSGRRTDTRSWRKRPSSPRLTTSPTNRWRAWGSWARRAWTTPERCPPCTPSPGTCPTSSATAKEVRKIG